MPLSTVTAAYTQYLANSSYDLNGSTSEAALFIEACRALLILQPKVSQQGRAGTRHEYDPAVVKDQLAAAVAWHRSSSTSTGAVGSLGFSDFRG
jgi:hypothetical protein